MGKIKCVGLIFERGNVPIEKKMFVLTSSIELIIFGTIPTIVKTRCLYN